MSGLQFYVSLRYFKSGWVGTKTDLVPYRRTRVDVVQLAIPGWYRLAGTAKAESNVYNT